MRRRSCGCGACGTKRTSNTNRNVPRIALTSGEPAGIGPDICLALAASELPCELVCLGDTTLLAERARQLKFAITLRAAARTPGAPPTLHTPGTLCVAHHGLAVPCVAGRPDPANARYVLELLERATDGALAGEFDALVTAPVHKGVINDAGIAFTGHTEFLAERARVSRPVMMLTHGTLRVALATTHLPLRAVSAAITIESLCEVASVLAAELHQRFRIDTPRIAVCGLNPHAGEGGHLGDEELRVIAPAIARLRATGIDVHGPLAADTAFVPQVLARFDAVLAMYHDQGLPVVKHSGFEQAVNVTLGLPFVRTSPDHGTALELAATGRADCRSLACALRLAATLATPRP